MIKNGYPKELLLIVDKSGKSLMFYGKKKSDKSCSLIKTYPIKKVSGKLGPKLKSGDKQTPEGIYEMESLNPKSRFHLALRVNYPNKFDIEMAGRDG